MLPTQLRFSWPTRAAGSPEPRWSSTADIQLNSALGFSRRKEMVHASIAAIEYYLPEAVLSTGDLAAEFPNWSVEKIEQKTGIQQRHIAGPDECSSDLA